VYWNSLPSNMGRGETATPNAATAWAQRPAPNSRAINPVMTIAAHCAITENNRRPIRDRPKRPRLMGSMNGVNGGYDTKPQSR
jgi:hypothetical protein